MAVFNDSFDLPEPLLTLNILPRHYDIKFMLYVNDDIFYGECNVSIYIPYKTSHIYIYTENLGITEIMVTENIQISKGNEEKIFAHRPKKLIHDTEYGTYISFPYDLPRGYHTLNMKFIGLLAENGGFRTFYINQQYNRMWLAATHYQTFATRRLFPLLKDTRYVSYNISIKHHKNYTALSNMPARAVNMDKNNMIWTHFESTPMMPDYFIAASVVHLDFILDTSQNVTLWRRTDMIPHRIFAYTVILKIAQLLKNIFPYIRKTPETNHIVIPKMLDVEEIKMGLIFYNETDIAFDQEIDPEIRKFEIIRIIGRKVVHEWFFYNAIFPYKWNSCLSKCFATFLGIYAADKSFPDFGIQDFFVVQMQYDVLHWSTKDIWPLKSQFNNSFELPRNIKVSIMLHTLQNTLTKEMFEIGIQTYLQNQYTSINDFWEVMQTVLYNTSFGVEYNYSIQDIISSWAELNHYPVVNVERDYNTFSLNISVENFNTNISIPVSITTRTYYNLVKFVRPVWLIPPNISNHMLIFNHVIKNDWILVDSQESGYYRVNYDAENWKRLSICLNDKYLFGQIHVLNRAKIIDDTFHFVMSGQLNRTLYLNILQYLRQDTDYIAWYPMFKNLEYISNFFAFPESALIKAKIKRPLIVIMKQIGYPNFKAGKINQNIDLKNTLREEIARWLCIMDDATCLTNANYKLMSYVSNDDKNSLYKIWTGWKEWIFCNGLKAANKDIWKKVFLMYWIESDYSVLKFLACSKNSLIIREYMYVMRFNVITQKAIVLRHVQSFCSIIARHAKDNIMLDFILRNLEDIKPEEISVITALTIIINHVYSKEQIKKINWEIGFKKNLVCFLINCDYFYQDDDEVNKYFSFNTKYKINMIIYVKRKLELRWNQIKFQLYEFRHLAENLEDILTQS